MHCPVRRLTNKATWEAFAVEILLRAPNRAPLIESQINQNILCTANCAVITRTHTHCLGRGGGGVKGVAERRQSLIYGAQCSILSSTCTRHRLQCDNGGVNLPANEPQKQAQPTGLIMLIYPRCHRGTEKKCRYFKNWFLWGVDTEKNLKTPSKSMH